MALDLEIDARYGVYTDTGGVTSAVAGNTLGSWKSISGNLVNSLFTQSNAARRPTLRSNSGIAEVEFTGTSINMGMTGLNWSGRTSYAWSMVMRFDSSVTFVQYRHIWGKSATSGWANGGCFMNRAPYGPSYTANFYPESYLNRSMEMNTPNRSTATRFVLSGSVDSSKICMVVNSYAMGIADAGTVALGTADLRIGDHMDNGGYGAGPNFFLSSFKFWDAGLTFAELLSEHATQMATWSITNTVTPPASGGGVFLPGGIFSNVLVT